MGKMKKKRQNKYKIKNQIRKKKKNGKKHENK